MMCELHDGQTRCGLGWVDSFSKAKVKNAVGRVARRFMFRDE